MTLDIDDTCDALHGRQHLSLFHAHYHVESGKPVAVLLRPGETPSGPEVRTLIKHLVRRTRYFPEAHGLLAQAAESDPETRTATLRQHMPRRAAALGGKALRRQELVSRQFPVEHARGRHGQRS